MTEQPPPQPSQGPPQAPPPGWGPPPGYYQAPPPTPGGATAALILGIAGLLVCPLGASIPALIIGRNAMREIDASQGRLGGRGTAQAGYILGIVGTVLGALATLVVIAVFALGGLIATQFDDCSFTDNGSSSTELHCD